MSDDRRAVTSESYMAAMNDCFYRFSEPDGIQQAPPDTLDGNVSQWHGASSSSTGPSYALPGDEMYRTSGSSAIFQADWQTMHPPSAALAAPDPGPSFSRAFASVDGLPARDQILLDLEAQAEVKGNLERSEHRRVQNRIAQRKYRDRKDARQKQTAAELDVMQDNATRLIEQCEFLRTQNATLRAHISPSRLKQIPTTRLDPALLASPAWVKVTDASARKDEPVISTTNTATPTASNASSGSLFGSYNGLTNMTDDVTLALPPTADGFQPNGNVDSSSPLSLKTDLPSWSENVATQSESKKARYITR